MGTSITVFSALAPPWSLQALDNNFAFLYGVVANVKAPPFNAAGDGVTDDTAAVQRAHDSLPASGGTIYFPGPGLNYLFAVDGVYVNITKPNVLIIGDGGTFIITPNSANAEDKTGNRTLTGFSINGATDCTIAINQRGCVNLWNPSAAGADRLTIRDMVSRNLYNSLISMGGTNGFDTLDVHNVLCDTSRDLTSDAGNYECIARSANGAAPPGNLVRVMGCTFRGVSGAIDSHCTRNLVVGGGTRFEGCDSFAIKMATLDGVSTEMNLVVDETVTFDGTALNVASANRHLSCTGLGRTVPNSSFYCGFIQVFNNVRFHGKMKGFLNNGWTYLNGSFTNAVLNHDGSRYDTCANAIVDAQGTFTMRGAELLTSTVLWTGAGAVRSLDISRCTLRDSVLNITKKSVAVGDLFSIRYNDIQYSVDNNAPLRFTNFGTDNGPVCLFDDNNIGITGGGNTLVASLSVNSAASTGAIWGPNNQATAAAGAPVISNGVFPSAYEQQTTAGVTSLYLFKLHHGEITVVNPGAAGTITYNINDASLVCPIGTSFNFVQSHATNPLVFNSTGGSVNQNVSYTTKNQWDRGTLTKVAANSWSMTPFAAILKRFALTYSASITPDVSQGNEFDITATNNTAFTINAPTNVSDGQRITITIRNASGGVLGAITWNAVFKMIAFTSPTNGNSCSIDFRYDGTNWVQIAPQSLQIPN